MQRPTELFTRGIGFARENPQIIYTLSLAVFIALAFFLTNDQFLSIARDGQNRLENERISFLHDGFTLFVAENIDRPDVLMKGIKKIASENSTMTSFRVLGTMLPKEEGEEGERYPIIASLAEKETGTELTIYDANVGLAFTNAGKDLHHTYHTEGYSAKGRYWESVRSVSATSSSEVAGYIMTDLSMAEGDTLAKNKIRNAFMVSIGIILLVLFLLGRQARIIDYSRLYARLKEIDQMKDDFVSMAAHELRSPLTVIRGYADILGDVEGIDAEGKKQVHLIDDAANRLSALIGDILDVAKLQEGRMSFKLADTDPDTVIQSVIDGFKKPAEDKGLVLSYQKGDTAVVTVDPERFRQILVNLVGNAVKYSIKGEVRVISKTEKGKFILRVSDTGLGISAEAQKHLFEKFYRVKTEATSHIEGTGLGLWITAKMISEMNGSIDVESIEGKGSDFIVTFPLS